MRPLIVAMPAKNEAHLIERALAAFADQSPAGADAFETIVLANDCTDGTAARARAFAASHPHLRLTVIEAVLPPQRAHIGTARRLAMDAAAERLEAAGGNGIIASTDADTVVDRDWIAATRAAMEEVEAVAGRIEILRADWEALPSALRLAYEQDGIYYRTVALLEATLDPLPWDPAPRHADHFGGSFAVSVSAYRRVGGVPLVDRLEDVALYRALLRADIPVRHALDVRVWTSGRRSGRVTGGFATHLEELATLHDWHVEDPRITIGLVRARAALRAAGGRGAAFDEIEREFRARCVYPPVAVDSALDALRCAIASENAARPTRSSAASGAG